MRRASRVDEDEQTNLKIVIASVRGEVSGFSGPACIVDVGGVGYAVTITEQHARSLSIGDSIRLATTLIVREDSMQLFGFETHVEQELFEALLTVSGVGPRSAMSVLSHVSPSEIYLAVVSEDDSVFKKVSGIGPKTAKLIIVSLTGKLSALSSLATDGNLNGANQQALNAGQSDATQAVMTALIGLGWTERVAADAVSAVVSKDSQVGSAELLRQALTRLGSSSTGTTASSTESVSR
jgi:Holliday junction DNA helicase RuvA